MMLGLFLGAILLAGPSAAFVVPYSSGASPRLPAASDFRLHVETISRPQPFAAPRRRAETNDDVLVGVPTYPEPSKSNALLEPLARFSEAYRQRQKDCYLQMAFLQAGVLASCADLATQTMEVGAVDFGHVAAMATVAAAMSGAANAAWLRQLEGAFPGNGTREVAYKTLIHALIIASIINSAYLAFVPFLATFVYHDGGAVDPSTILFSGWSLDEFVTLTKLEVLMFIPYNTLAFKFVPPAVRPLTHAAISATFNVAVSAVTLGYFDRWCENAVRIFA